MGTEGIETVSVVSEEPEDSEDPKDSESEDSRLEESEEATELAWGVARAGARRRNRAARALDCILNDRYIGISR